MSFQTAGSAYLSRSTNLPSGAAGYTYAFWFKPVATPTSPYHYFWSYDNGGGTYTALGFPSASTAVVLETTGGTTSVVTQAVGSWHFYAIRVSGGSVTLLHRDNAAGTLTTATAATYPGDGTSVYLMSDGYGETIESGIMAYARRWNAALSDAEILAESSAAAAVRTANLDTDMALTASPWTNAAGGGAYTVTGTPTASSDVPSSVGGGGTTVSTSAAFGASVGIAGSAVARRNTAGALGASVGLAGSSSTAVTSSASLGVSAGIAGADVTQRAASAALGASAGLAGSPVAQRSASASLAASVGFSAANGASANLPPKLGPGGARYLVDQLGNPWLMNSDTAWSLFGQLTNAQADTYLANRSAKGFNATIASLIENAFSSNHPANIYGEAPFTDVPFGTPNEAYFSRADWVIDKAASYGITLILHPCYVGHSDIEGWGAEIASATTTQMQAWGSYVGNRYKNKPNIIWVVGGDRTPDAAMKTKLNAFITGLLSQDTNHLVTAHNSPESTAFDYGDSRIVLNSVYTYSSDVSVESMAAYNVTPAAPYFFQEGQYENEYSSTAQRHRAQAILPLLCGATGSVFGNCPIWHFSSSDIWCGAIDYTTQLNSPSSIAVPRAVNVFTRRPWHTLAPDTSNLTLTSGLGTAGTADHAVCARASDGATAIAYLPTQRAVTFAMSRISGATTNVWWLNPATGYATSAGSFATSGTQSLTPPGTGDWLLIVDDASRGFVAPDGGTVSASLGVSVGVSGDPARVLLTSASFGVSVDTAASGYGARSSAVALTASVAIDAPPVRALQSAASLSAGVDTGTAAIRAVNTAADLSILVSISTSSGASAVASASLAAALAMGGTTTAIRAGACALSAGVALDGTPVRQMVSASSLGVTLDAAAAGVRAVSSSGSLGASVGLAGAMPGEVPASVALGASVGFGGGATVVISTSAALGIAAGLAGSGYAGVGAAGAFGMALGLDGAGTPLRVSSAELGAAVALAASASGAVTVTSALIASADLAGGAVAMRAAAAELGAAIGILAAHVPPAPLVASLGIAAGVAGYPVRVVTTSAAFGVGVGLMGSTSLAALARPRVYAQLLGKPRIYAQLPSMQRA